MVDEWYLRGWWLQNRIPTLGGFITITGSNFGAGMEPNASTPFASWLVSTGRSVTVDDAPCVIASWSNDLITCQAPEGVAEVSM